MKRKLVKHGQSTLMVSLPIKWLRTKKLNKGDDIYFGITDENLILSAGETRQEPKKIELDATDLEKSAFLKHLTSLYEQDYDEINVMCDEELMQDSKTGRKVPVSGFIQGFVDRLIGMEIISQRKGLYVIKQISEQNPQEFDNALRRIFFLMLEFQDSIKEALQTNNFSELKKAYEKHDNITKFISFCTRLLNKDSRLRETKYCILLNSLDMMTDFLRYCSDDLLERKKITQNCRKIILNIILFFQMFNKYFYKRELKSYHGLIYERRRIKEEIERSKVDANEMIIITRFSNNIELINNLLKYWLPEN